MDLSDALSSIQYPKHSSLALPFLYFGGFLWVFLFVCSFLNAVNVLSLFSIPLVIQTIEVFMVSVLQATSETLNTFTFCCHILLNHLRKYGGRDQV